MVRILLENVFSWGEFHKFREEGRRAASCPTPAAGPVLTEIFIDQDQTADSPSSWAKAAGPISRTEAKLVLVEAESITVCITSAPRVKCTTFF